MDAPPPTLVYDIIKTRDLQALIDFDSVAYLDALTIDELVDVYEYARKLCVFDIMLWFLEEFPHLKTYINQVNWLTQCEQKRATHQATHHEAAATDCVSF